MLHIITLLTANLALYHGTDITRWSLFNYHVCF